MSQTYGIEAPKEHVARPHRRPVRFVIVIDSGGASIARLLLDDRQQIDELDGSASEVAQLIQGIGPRQGADGPEWDAALMGHSTQERRAADVYTLPV